MHGHNIPFLMAGLFGILDFYITFVVVGTAFSIENNFMIVLTIFVCSVKEREGVLNVEETMPVLGEEWDETARSLICTPIRVCIEKLTMFRISVRRFWTHTSLLF